MMTENQWVDVCARVNFSFSLIFKQIEWPQDGKTEKKNLLTLLESFEAQKKITKKTQQLRNRKKLFL